MGDLYKIRAEEVIYKGQRLSSFLETTTGFIADAPLVLHEGELSLQKATVSADGYLSATDWGIFNSKENSLGLPSVSGYVLISTDTGVRSWVAFPTPVLDHANLTNLDYAGAGHTGFQPVIPSGLTTEFYRGDKTWQEIPSGITSHSTLTQLDYASAGHTGFETTTNKENTTLDTSTEKYPTVNLVKTAVDLKANIASPTFTGTVSGISSAMVGLGSVDNVQQIPMSYLSTDTTMGGVSPVDTKVASQKAVKLYADNLISTANALVYKGVVDCSTDPVYPAANAGDLYIVSEQGHIGGASGVSVEEGDMCLCNTDNSPSGDQAAVGTNWNIVEKNISGAVTGPASGVANNVAFFDGSTGKVIKDMGVALTGSNTGDNSPNSNSVAKIGDTMEGSLTLVSGTESVFPIKMIAGTNLTAPVSGVFEYNGSSLFFSLA